MRFRQPFCGRKFRVNKALRFILTLTTCELTNGFNFDSIGDFNGGNLIPGKDASRPVSRVLSMGRLPCPLDDHSSGTPVAGRFTQPTRMTGPETALNARRHPRHPYSVLLPVGFAWTAPVAGSAVRSYRTFSPLRQALSSPHPRFVSVALSLGSPPPGVTRHRVSMEPGLSSPAPFRASRQRSSSQLAEGR